MGRPHQRCIHEPSQIVWACIDRGRVVSSVDLLAWTNNRRWLGRVDLSVDTDSRAWVGGAAFAAHITHAATEIRRLSMQRPRYALSLLGIGPGLHCEVPRRGTKSPKGEPKRRVARRSSSACLRPAGVCRAAARPSFACLRPAGVCRAAAHPSSVLGPPSRHYNHRA
jgi:hypothetical protein